MKLAFILLTSIFSPASAIPTTTVPPGPAAPIQTVIVGGTSLGFNPPTLEVAQGSRVHFDFRAVNHTLTESTFKYPCEKLFGTDIDTDFNNANPDNTPNLHPFDYTFSSDRPRFFYCKQGAGTNWSHCRQGEVFAVNVDARTFAEFQNRAKGSQSP
ncbi:hypothetical protein EYZ11_012111 [Aspergillus tanneri]|uniref:AA1-like domain-containing protein n=1 Tax=Aspergillus tanneri TaxID=1220188 RepID=A0A4S3J120_9EURO|nr:uncharacterized protein ATNIH1004_008159 [Aspergillus tanneri]KAA8643963.1 hypothetical protein ATNIH1004_008159 [Aspergillus tanneri]THC88439.1 hypothetical protein EYZ11_012111 [Aspergillus tanneri]